MALIASGPYHCTIPALARSTKNCLHMTDRGWPVGGGAVVIWSQRAYEIARSFRGHRGRYLFPPRRGWGADVPGRGRAFGDRRATCRATWAWDGRQRARESLAIRLG
eukprot:354458-Chlamydomonas_euryale.AAC.7